MADIENKYYQVGEDGADSQTVTSGRWFKPGIAFFCGFGLALLYITAQSASESTQHMTNSAESTNLVGLSPYVRPSIAAGKPSMIHAMGPCALPGCSPYQKIAISAFEAQNEGKRARDVAMMATMDTQTKAVMAEVESAAFKMKEMSGVTAPLGFWDPMGLSADASEGKLLFWREAELKHGRVAMLATLGIAVGEKFHPWFGVGDIPSYQVFGKSSLQIFWVSLAIFAFFLEAVTLDGWGEGGMKPGYIPGDLKFDPLGLKPKDEKGFKELQTKELNNGRLAMFASLGMLAQEMVTGQKLFN